MFFRHCAFDLPVLVSLKRFAADLLVFSLGIVISFSAPLFFISSRHQHNRHNSAFHHRRFFNLTVSAEILNKTLQDFSPQIHKGNFAAAKNRLILTLSFPKSARLLQLDMIIVVFDVRFYANLFEVRNLDSS